jgi:hypothetical protein
MRRVLDFSTAARRALPALALFAAAQGAEAQLPSPSAAALGLGDNYTALARGYSAAAWNPAGLGMPGNPTVSFALMSIRGLAGLDPINLSDLADYQGELVPTTVKEEWLSRITAEGSEQGTAGADVNYLAVNVGRVGLHFATNLRAVGDVGPGVAELVLFGNAGRTGTPTDFTLEGSAFDVVATSTGGLSYAQPLMRTPSSSLSLGATVKYTMGHLLFTGADAGSQVTADPLAVDLRFPIAQTDTILMVDHLNNGGGVGVDLGLAWQSGGISAGLAVKNVFNSFEWDESKLFYRPGEALFNADSTGSEFGARPLSAAPAGLQDRVAGLNFGPEIAAGLAYQMGRRLTLSADVRHRLEESRLGEPTSHVGAGAELRLLRWLPLRVGGAVLPGGNLIAGGVGLEFGVANLTASAAQRQTELGTDQMLMFTFSSFRF